MVEVLYDPWEFIEASYMASDWSVLVAVPCVLIKNVFSLGWV